VPKDKILLRDTPTTKIQPHKPDETPKDKTLLRETPTTKIEKPDVSKDKTHDLPIHKTRPYKSVEKIEVYYTYITHTHTFTHTYSHTYNEIDY